MHQWPCRFKPQNVPAASCMHACNGWHREFALTAGSIVGESETTADAMQRRGSMKAPGGRQSGYAQLMLDLSAKFAADAHSSQVDWEVRRANEWLEQIKVATAEEDRLRQDEALEMLSKERQLRRAQNELDEAMENLRCEGKQTGPTSGEDRLQRRLKLLETLVKERDAQIAAQQKLLNEKSGLKKRSGSTDYLKPLPKPAVQFVETGVFAAGPSLPASPEPVRPPVDHSAADPSAAEEAPAQESSAKQVTYGRRFVERLKTQQTTALGELQRVKSARETDLRQVRAAQFELGTSALAVLPMLPPRAAHAKVPCSISVSCSSQSSRRR